MPEPPGRYQHSQVIEFESMRTDLHPTRQYMHLSACGYDNEHRNRSPGVTIIVDSDV